MQLVPLVAAALEHKALAVLQVAAAQVTSVLRQVVPAEAAAQRGRAEQAVRVVEQAVRVVEQAVLAGLLGAAEPQVRLRARAQLAKMASR